MKKRKKRRIRMIVKMMMTKMGARIVK